MGLVIYLDGEYVPEERAVVSVFDHGLLYGDGVFEGIRAYNNRVFKLEEHIDRLYESAKAILLEIPLSKEETTEVVLETLRRNNLRDGYVRLVVTRGVGDLGLDPKKCDRASMFCISSSIQLYPEEMYEQGLPIITVPTRRNLAEAVNPRIKSLNYLNNVLGKIEASQAGVIEAVMLSAEGYVAEATADNIFIVKKGVLITPPVHVGVLEGITRNTVMDLARERLIPVEERVFTRYDIFIADEFFLTGTAAEVMPVIEVDGRKIGDGHPGEITKTLMQAYRRLTLQEGPEIFK